MEENFCGPIRFGKYFVFFVYNVNCEIVTILGPDCFGVKWKSGNTNSRT